MDNLRDLVANVEFLGRKHVDLRMRHNYDIIMALILYHRCGMHFAYQQQDGQQGNIVIRSGTLLPIITLLIITSHLLSITLK
ncbi:unnamed protein product [Spirodela intermedia]|uniref:Uncharacterized protein n=1 Tax=Spirodela intermedia TaxID=51605 RepID=A0A7I8IWP2_SPIIN|nr:unnamed protein product [Spirodela intermedia]CAA6662397.1 unnamed protein product [Spirodela intermedia]